ncbi:MAG: T9SS type A sorting domain-containing protein [Bacteroidota bacterium]
MKTKIFTLLLIISTLIYKNASAQVLCIYCYDQNDSISHGVHNLIQNGGFENTNCVPNNWAYSTYCPNSGFYNCDIANWTCTGGGVNTYADITDSNFVVIVEGTKAAYFGNQGTLICSATYGDTSCLEHVDCTVFGLQPGYPVSRYPGYGDYSGISLKQTVAGLTIGATYVLEFWAGGEQDNFFLNKSIFGVDVGFGDTMLTEKPTARTNGIGTRYIIEFIANATTHTIKFTNWGHICLDCTELILDDIRLYSLSELDASVTHCVAEALIKTPTINDYATTEIYPNPTGSVLSVKTFNKERLTIMVYDILSRKLLSQEFTGNADIDIERLSRGIYLYQIINDKGMVKNGKIVKE